MLAALTHTEYGVVVDRYAILAGGNAGRHILADLIQVYDTQADRWRLAGRLPYCMKTTTVYHDGWLYVIAGQRSRSPDDLTPGEVLSNVWRAKFDPGVTGN